MNDHHLDPPDYPEPPEWYCILEMYLEDETPPKIVEDAIRKAMDEWTQSHNEQRHPDPEPDPVVELPDNFFAGPERCPHNRPWGDCGHCDYLSDIAYDTARESRLK